MSEADGLMYPARQAKKRLQTFPEQAPKYPPPPFPLFSTQEIFMKLDTISHHPDTSPRPTPLLFVHGSFSDARVWRDNFLPYFARHGYPAHAFSLRGHGRF